MTLGESRSTVDTDLVPVRALFTKTQLYES